MKVITNPTDQDIYIIFHGKREDCEANGSTVVKDDVAKYWKRTHQFVGMSNHEEGNEIVSEPESPAVEPRTEKSERKPTVEKAPRKQPSAKKK